MPGGFPTVLYGAPSAAQHVLVLCPKIIFDRNILTTQSVYLYGKTPPGFSTLAARNTVLETDQDRRKH